jgi:hypothetical protein
MLVCFYTITIELFSESKVYMLTYTKKTLEYLITIHG